MNFEGVAGINKNETRPMVGELVNGFRELSSLETVEQTMIFEELESGLEAVGFTTASTPEVSSVINNNSLMCRSESFENVLNLILAKKPIDLADGDYANMCIMAYGEGFRTAMIEGFSGKEVNGIVKVVLTFHESHLTSRKKLPVEDDLWLTKPETAKVSLVGKGQIAIDDIEMISFRFPIRFYPNRLLTEEEKERLEDDNISFIVRHYVLDKKITTH